MKQIIAWVIGLPVALALIGFALANRSIATISFDPISTSDPWLAFSAPVWMILFAGILIGMMVGGFVSWLSQGKWRKAARNAQSDLQTELSKKKDLERRLNQNNLSASTAIDTI